MLIEMAHFDTPLGKIVLGTAGASLCALYFRDSEAEIVDRLKLSHPDATFGTGAHAKAATRTLQAYFEGDLTALDALAVSPVGTDFQKEVWSALRTIPVGATTSYGKLAGTIGRPAAVRAVGAANGANPISLVVPCHRVIAANGTLHGYGGGLWRKEWLLKHEKALLA